MLTVYDFLGLRSNQSLILQLLSEYVDSDILRRLRQRQTSS